MKQSITSYLALAFENILFSWKNCELRELQKQDLTLGGR